MRCEIPSAVVRLDACRRDVAANNRWQSNWRIADYWSGVTDSSGGRRTIKGAGLCDALERTAKLQGGELPTTEIAEGLILAVSGALLLTPGFVTDLIGFAGLIPPIRVLVATRIMKNMLVMGAQSGGFQTGRGPSNSPPNGDGNGETIEGEAWERKDLD